MDDFRIDSLGFDDSLYEQREDGSKQRSKRRNLKPEEEPADEVVLSSGGDSEEPPSGYVPNSSAGEPK
jgi:hypothetical protein